MGSAAVFLAPIRHDGFFASCAAASALSALSRAELEALLVELFGKVSALEKIVGEQREEIARLKGVKGRPPIKPSGMDGGTEPSRPATKEKRRFRGKVTPRVSIEDHVVKAAVPDGSVFKGYKLFLVHDLVISANAVCYRRERWVTPDGRTILAPLPGGIDGHFGLELRRFVPMQYYQGQSAPPRLAALPRSVGVSVAKRQLQRLLRTNRRISLPKRRVFCAPGWKHRLMFRWTAPARGIRRGTASARRSATTGSLGSARGSPRAG